MDQENIGAYLVRIILGLLVLIGGILVLGLLGRDNFAEDVEARVEKAANAIAAKYDQNIAVDVSGRDITVSGEAETPEQKTALLAEFNRIEGRRLIVDELTIEPVQSPFTLSVIRDASGERFSGYRPTDEAFDGLIGSSTANLETARGQPDENWTRAVEVGVTALRRMENGTLSVSDNALTLTGTAASLKSNEMVKSVLATLPAGYSVTENWQITPTTPYVFKGEKKSAQVSFSGYAPSAEVQSELAKTIGAQSANSLSLEFGMPDADWPRAAAIGAEALALLSKGSIDLTDRALRVTGETASPETELNLRQILNRLPSGYTSALSIDVQPVSPYLFTGTIGSDGRRFNGFAPSVQTRDRIAADIGANAKVALTLGAGMPDSDWPDVAIKAASALGRMSSGSMRLSDRQLTLFGTLPSPAAEIALKNALSDLPIGYSVSLDLDITPVSPYVFSGSKSDGGVVYSGYVPSDAIRTDLAGTIGSSQAARLALGAGMPDASWPDAARIGAEQLALLANGSLRLSDTELTLSGTAPNPEAAEQIEIALSALPTGYSAQSNITVTPISPYRFTAIKGVDGSSVQGFVPSRDARAALALAIGTSKADALDLAAGAPNEAWTDAITVGMSALENMESGVLEITDTDLSITGDAFDPTSRAMVQEKLANLPDGYSADFQVGTLDDGTPLRLLLEYDAQSGGTISGKAPKGLTKDALANQLQLANLSGDITNSILSQSGMDAPFASLSVLLPKLESLNLAVTPDNVRFKGTALPGEDLDALRLALRAGLGAQSDIQLGRSPSEPNEGDQRVNPETGAKEVYENRQWVLLPPEFIDGDTRENPQTGTPEMFQGGVWIALPPTPQDGDTRINPETGNNEIYQDNTWVVIVPEPQPEPEPEPEPLTAALCQVTTDTALEGVKLNFLSGSDTLDDASLALLDELAPTVASCVDSNSLTIEIGGHTDSRGGAAFNADLSLRRATSVGIALVDRGVSPSGIIAVGYGETRPIASNDTAAGRAQNRRITLQWQKNEE